MKTKFVSTLLSVMMFFCLFLSGCGGTNNQESGSSSKQSGSETDGSQAIPSTLQTANDALDGNAENVITIGLVTHHNDEILKIASRFNEAQPQYKLKLVQYGYDNLLISILQKQGPDILLLRDLPVEMLTQKGILEDLTSYFASSNVVRREDILSAVWKAGSIEGKMSCLIPAFMVEGIIVEKGHTNNGGWTVADYFALAERYPEGMINQDIADPRNLFLNDLTLSPDRYIDWEAGICSFDSRDFVEFLEELKEYSNKKYDISLSGTPAERLYKREYLTLRGQLVLNDFMSEYLSLKVLLGDEFEYAGYPGVDGEPCYRMLYEYAFGMNAFSSKKEGAWMFLEYLLSEPVQESYVHPESKFPARLDVLNQSLQEAMDFDSSQYKGAGFYNSYTQEMEKGRAAFTEEDRQTILEMLDHVKRFSVMTSGDIAYILLEELKSFFDGSKTAEDTAAIIQNRVQLYLDELG